MLADGQSTNTTCKQDKLLVINYVKFHLTTGILRKYAYCVVKNLVSITQYIETQG